MVRSTSVGGSPVGWSIALFINMGGRSSVLGLNNEGESFYSGFGAVIS